MGPPRPRRPFTHRSAAAEGARRVAPGTPPSPRRLPLRWAAVRPAPCGGAQGPRRLRCSAMTRALVVVVVVHRGEGAVRGRRAPGRRALWAPSLPVPRPSAPRPLSTGQLPPLTSRAAATHVPAGRTRNCSPPGEAGHKGLYQLRG